VSSITIPQKAHQTQCGGEKANTKMGDTARGADEGIRKGKETPMNKGGKFKYRVTVTPQKDCGGGGVDWEYTGG